MVFIYQAYGMDDPQPIYDVLIMAHTLWQTMFDYQRYLKRYPYHILSTYVSIYFPCFHVFFNIFSNVSKRAFLPAPENASLWDLHHGAGEWEAAECVAAGGSQEGEGNSLETQQRLDRNIPNGIISGKFIWSLVNLLLNLQISGRLTVCELENPPTSNR